MAYKAGFCHGCAELLDMLDRIKDASIIAQARDIHFADDHGIKKVPDSALA